jgi:hypothetical protein
VHGGDGGVLAQGGRQAVERGARAHREGGELRRVVRALDHRALEPHGVRAAGLEREVVGVEARPGGEERGEGEPGQAEGERWVLEAQEHAPDPPLAEAAFPMLAAGYHDQESGEHRDHGEERDHDAEAGQETELGEAQEARHQHGEEAHGGGQGAGCEPRREALDARRDRDRGAVALGQPLLEAVDDQDAEVDPHAEDDRTEERGQERQMPRPEHGGAHQQAGCGQQRRHHQHRPPERGEGAREEAQHEQEGQPG